MSKVRVYEIAKQLNVPAKELVERLRALGEDVKSHSSSVDSSVIAKLQQAEAPAQPEPEPAPPAPKPKPKPKPAPEPAPAPVVEEVAAPQESAPAAAAGIHVHRGITVKDFAERITRGNGSHVLEICETIRSSIS